MDTDLKSVEEFAANIPERFTEYTKYCAYWDELITLNPEYKYKSLGKKVSNVLVASLAASATHNHKTPVIVLDTHHLLTTSLLRKANADVIVVENSLAQCKQMYAKDPTVELINNELGRFLSSATGRVSIIWADLCNLVRTNVSTIKQVCKHATEYVAFTFTVRDNQSNSSYAETPSEVIDIVNKVGLNEGLIFNLIANFKYQSNKNGGAPMFFMAFEIQHNPELKIEILRLRKSEIQYRSINVCNMLVYALCINSSSNLVYVSKEEFKILTGMHRFVMERRNSHVFSAIVNGVAMITYECAINWLQSHSKEFDSKHLDCKIPYLEFGAGVCGYPEISPDKFTYQDKSFAEKMNPESVKITIADTLSTMADNNNSPSTKLKIRPPVQKSVEPSSDIDPQLLLKLKNANKRFRELNTQRVAKMQKIAQLEREIAKEREELTIIENDCGPAINEKESLMEKIKVILHEL
jgi:hypothetical protein